MLKLFTVTLETELVVLANTPEEAEESALDELRSLDRYNYSAQASDMRHLPADWEMGAIPHGTRDSNDPDRTIEEWIEKGAAPEYKKP
jgi:hypothetical protein